MEKRKEFAEVGYVFCLNLNCPFGKMV